MGLPRNCHPNELRAGLKAAGMNTAINDARLEWIVSHVAAQVREQLAPTTLDELEALYPKGAVEIVSKRRECVVYTGLTSDDDGQLREITQAEYDAD